MVHSILASLLEFEYERLPQGLVLKAWSSAGGIILGGATHFRRWLWLEEGHWGACSWQLYIAWLLLVFPFPLLPLCHEVKNLLTSKFLLP
jgi:hypothetical protein